MTARGTLYQLYKKKKMNVYLNSIETNMRQQQWFSHHKYYASTKPTAPANSMDMFETHGLVHAMLFTFVCEKKLWTYFTEFKVSHVRICLVFGKFINSWLKALIRYFQETPFVMQKQSFWLKDIRLVIAVFQKKSCLFSWFSKKDIQVDGKLMYILLVIKI